MSDDLKNEEENSFNDQELQDIMSEIEDLEKDIGVDADLSPKDIDITAEDTTDTTVAENPTNIEDDVLEALENSDSVLKDETELSAVVEEPALEATTVDETVEEQLEHEVSGVIEEITESDHNNEVFAQEEVSSETTCEDIETTEYSDNVVSITKPNIVEKSEKQSPFGLNFSGEGSYSFNMDFPVGDKTVHFEVGQNNQFSLDFDKVKFSVQGDQCVVEMEGGATFTLPLSSSESTKVKKAS